MTKDNYKCIIAVKAARRNAANTFFKNNIDRVGGENTFTTGISATGNAPATWFIAHTQLQEWQLAKLVQVADANPTDVRIIIWAYRRGLKSKLAAKMANRAYITIANGEQTPQEFLDEFGMKVVKTI